jgi:hypothetical protein
VNEPRRLQARLESSDYGRLAISVLVFTVLVLVLFANLHEMGFLGYREGSALDTTITSVGLGQLWSMFAPPPESSATLIVELEYPDGSVRRWHWPRTRWGQYRAYHWGKFEESIVMSRQQPPADGLRTWVLQRDWHHTGSKPRAVRLIEQWKELAPPGPGKLVIHEHLDELEPGDPEHAPATVSETI